MADERDDSQRTEEPTARRLDEAREQGRVASSRDATSCLLLGLAAIVAGGSLPMGWGRLQGALAGLLAHAHDRPGDVGALAQRLLDAAAAALGVLALPLGGAAMLAILASMAQHGPLFTPAALRPQLSRISLTAGFTRLLSSKSVVALIQSCLKIALVVAAAVAATRGGLGRIAATAETEAGGMLSVTSDLTARLLLATAAVAAVSALADFLWQRHSLLRQLRMTRQEVADDHKLSEGDPIIRQRLRALRMASARRRMMAAVPKATVVVTNPTHFAVALRYAPGEAAAPVVVAKGVDAVAARIRALALDHGVPLVENPPLARLLHRLVEVGQPVPPAHYQAVAEIIGYVMRLRERGRR